MRSRRIARSQTDLEVKNTRAKIPVFPVRNKKTKNKYRYFGQVSAGQISFRKCSLKMSRFFSIYLDITLLRISGVLQNSEEMCGNSTKVCKICFFLMQSRFRSCWPFDRSKLLRLPLYRLIRFPDPPQRRRPS